MIVKMHKKATQQDYEHLIKALEAKKFKIRDVSSDTVKIFGVIGDTASLDIHDVKAYEGVEQVIRVQSPFKQASRTFKEEDTIITINKDLMIGGNHPVMIAGPCSVESEAQLDLTAKFLSEQGVKVLRGGAFKPRTSPYTFQGLEVEGLKIMRRVADKYGMSVISEIPSAEHLEVFNTYTDIIQVGARNMQNFDLLKALGKAKRPIMLKRGLSATIEEWLMSAEYIIHHGNAEVILAERGIRTFETYTRNTLDISSVLAVKHLSHLPIIIDPSHAAGRWHMIEDLSKAALAVGAHGLMVEVHHNPETALSDGAQSLKFDTFESMMTQLHHLSNALNRPLK